MRGAWMRELAGWVGALAVAVILTGQVAASDRAELLFRDGDSLIVALSARSLLSGEPLGWAMSSVLFLPETALFTALDLLLPFDVNGILAMNAVINLVAFYGAVRLVAGRRRSGTAPVAWSLAALVAFSAVAATETSASRDALELASLTSTTTYYSATVIAVVLSVGLVRRALDDPRGGAWRLVILAAVAAVSTLSNPLYAVWATVPLTVVLLLATVRSAEKRRMLTLLGILLSGTVVGFIVRIPFEAWIANAGTGYARPELWRESLAYYSQLFGDRLATPLGTLGVLLSLALLAWAVVRTVRAEHSGSRLVASIAWVMPAVVVIGAIALGTHAARYLQPAAFAPVLALVACPRAVPLPRRVARASVGVLAALAVIGTALSVPRVAGAATAADQDLTCVTNWVDASGRTGAGQFWTVRLPKLHLDDPARLVQVDHQLRGYAWLVNRHDFAVGEVSFLVEDAQTVPWQLPRPAVPEEIVDCGRYRILDFGAVTLPIGPQRS
ncbi:MULTISPECIES: hypothetical protein [unclassified Microbacterium]|uniref:hypothetical protein n=1 Tax=unclassified Microbacterium TaxID=2609290 RepID=UPI000EA92053|nr:MULTISPECIES: hypothetical protein [unclassified Microbacterium]MBT2484121.1 hypothetical protein [Microbacterium sp. ISL-108]RKN67068.1 hypothetical protein D7252_05360 [Microbacterium sp. CGR2]